MRVLKFLRYAVSTVIMLGAAPEFLLIWSMWKGVSLFLPPWMYQLGDDITYSIYQRLVLFFFNHCTGVKVYFYGESESIFKKKETALYLGNHQSTVDWILTNMVAVEQGSLGHLRFVMKHELQMLPLYGFYFYQHGCIYVKRGQFQPAKMLRSLRYLQNPKIPTWVVIFPEGTRYNPDDSKQLARTREVAREHNLPELQYHLTPRARGAWLVVQNLHNRLDAVYDVTVGYGGSECGKGTADITRNKAPQLIDFLLGRSKEVHIHVRRIPMSAVPLEENKFQLWIHNLFIEKDKLMRQFYQSEEMGTPLAWPNKRLQGLRLWQTLPSLAFFSALSIPLLLTKIGRSLYLKSLIYGTLGGYAWLVISSVC